MKTSTFLFFALVASGFACLPPQHQDPAAQAQAAQYQAYNDTAAAANDAAAEALFEDPQRYVNDVVVSAKSTLGLEKGRIGGENQRLGPASERFAELRKAGFKFHFEKSESPVGGPPMYQLVDDLIMDREAARRNTENPSPAIANEYRRRHKYTYKLLDLSMQSLEAMHAAWGANAAVQRQRSAYLKYVATNVRALDGSKPTQEWRTKLKTKLGTIHRFETVAAAATAQFAAYEAVAAGRDPKGLDIVAKATLETLADKTPPPIGTDQELDAILASLPDELEEDRARHEATMRKLLGDKTYEGFIKQQSDAQYSLKTQASTFPQATRPLASSSASNAKAASSPAASGGNANGLGALDVSSLPKDGTLRSSIQGVDALMQGDYKTAMSSAVGLLPGGGVLKDGLALAFSLFKI